MDTKKCSKCNEVLPLSSFHKHKRHADGYHSMCKKCRGCRVKTLKPGYKICSICNKELPLTDYNNQKNGFLGKRSYCRECQRRDSKIYKKSEQGKIIANAWKKTEKGRLCNQRYKNKKETKQHDKEYREVNKERINEARKKYRTTEQAKQLKRVGHQKRRTLKKKLPASLTKDDWLNCLNYFNNECAYCGGKKKLTQDHFIPLSNGGEYTINNIIPVCNRCNISKKNRDFFEWYLTQDFYDKRRERKILKYLNYKNSTIQQLALL